ncbi:replication protein A [mine drainage metagenome]|uniref:Replication protein A n=1 Tax=mine drainage metagenome TaxID=410659 RepID=T0ZRW0_9ZZZZ
MDENSNQDMAGVVGRLESLATQTGAAVLFLHHVSKGAIYGGSSDGQYAARGASALTDQSRWAAALSGMTKQEAGSLGESGAAKVIGEANSGLYVRLSVPKSSYGQPINDRWFKRHEGGVLRPVELEKGTSQRGKGAKEPVSKKGPAAEDVFNWGDDFS